MSWTEKQNKRLRRNIWQKCQEIAIMSAIPFKKLNWQVLARIVRALTTDDPRSNLPADVQILRDAILREGDQPAYLTDYNPFPDEREMFLTQDEHKELVA